MFEKTAGVLSIVGSAVRVVFGLVLFSLLSACSLEQLGLPRVAVEATSPDGSTIALVRNHMEFDPPSQSLWLRGPEGKVPLLRLGADQDWCDTVVWSADSSYVAFLVQDARLIVVDARRSLVVRSLWLVEAPRHYPPQQKMINLALAQDGSHATFQRCPRRGDGPCSQTERIALR